MTPLARRMIGPVFWVLALGASNLLWSDEAAQESLTVRYRVIGLFSPEREADLREAAEKMADVTLTEVDYPRGEVVFTYDPGGILKGAKPEQVRTHLENSLKNASNHTFALKALSEIPREKLHRVEIAVGVLDCKACGYGLYLAVMNADGVEQAQVNVKKGMVTAWLNPEKIDRAQLVDLLKKREVRIRD
jgi:hypothetical protein